MFELAKSLHGQKKDREALPLLEETRDIYQQLGPVWAKSVQRVTKYLDEARKD